MLLDDGNMEVHFLTLTTFVCLKFSTITSSALLHLYFHFLLKNWKIYPLRKIELEDFPPGAILEWHQ